MRNTSSPTSNIRLFAGARAIVSAFARYLGKTRPDAMDQGMRTISAERSTRMLCGNCAAASGSRAEQDRASAVVQMRIHVYPKRILLELVPGRGGAELEAWSLEGSRLLPRGLPSRALRRSCIEGADGTRVEQRLQGCGTASNRELRASVPLRRRMLGRLVDEGATRTEARNWLSWGHAPR